MSFHVSLNYHTTIYDLFKVQKATDVKFLCSNDEIGAHSIVLKANSEWFQNNGNISAVALIHYSTQTVAKFLTLLYCGSSSCHVSSSLRKLLKMFQCKFELYQINGISNGEVEIEDDSPSASDSDSLSTFDPRDMETEEDGDNEIEKPLTNGVKNDTDEEEQNNEQNFGVNGLEGPADM